MDELMESMEPRMLLSTVARLPDQELMQDAANSIGRCRTRAEWHSRQVGRSLARASGSLLCCGARP